MVYAAAERKSRKSYVSAENRKGFGFLYIGFQKGQGVRFETR